MNILLFGVLTDIIKAQHIEITSVSTTDELIKHIEEKYPEIKKYNYQIVVNQHKAFSNTAISDSDEIALLPPFAGG
jgi:sulfur-carrier protein